jgi:hypothetical protein
LKSATQKRRFRVYKDKDIGFVDSRLKKFLSHRTADDDVDSDDEVMYVAMNRVKRDLDEMFNILLGKSIPFLLSYLINCVVMKTPYPHLIRNCRKRRHR